MSSLTRSASPETIQRLNSEREAAARGAAPAPAQVVSQQAKPAPPWPIRSQPLAPSVLNHKFSLPPRSTLAQTQGQAGPGSLRIRAPRTPPGPPPGTPESLAGTPSFPPPNLPGSSSRQLPNYNSGLAMRNWTSGGINAREFKPWESPRPSFPQPPAVVRTSPGALASTLSLNSPKNKSGLVGSPGGQQNTSAKRRRINLRNPGKPPNFKPSGAASAFGPPRASGATNIPTLPGTPRPNVANVPLVAPVARRPARAPAPSGPSGLPGALAAPRPPRTRATGKPAGDAGPSRVPGAPKVRNSTTFRPDCEDCECNPDGECTCKCSVFKIGGRRNLKNSRKSRKSKKSKKSRKSRNSRKSRKNNNKNKTTKKSRGH